MRKMLAKTLPYLKERVQGGQMEEPWVELRQLQGDENENENEGKKQMVAALKYACAARSSRVWGDGGHVGGCVFCGAAGDDGAQVG